MLFYKMKRKTLLLYHICILILVFYCCPVVSFREYSRQDIRKLREEVREMFHHAYNGYLQYASGYDELRPLSCDGINTWGSYSLTLIDALDTLVVMGNYTEFRRVVKLLTEKSNFDADINVSVFETNIRIVGGLLSAHLMSERAGLELEDGWPCNGPLLRLAEDVAKRLLPAFDTKTGMPYGTVNLRYGVPSGETPVTCTAGVGTFIVEFGALSRLTGNPIFEEVALNALYALWNYKSSIGLFGNHIDVQTGRWTAQDSGIGAGVDSFYEYLVKGALLLNRPELLELFYEGRKAIDKYLRKDDWHVWVSMSKGQVTLPVFQSLEAYWPGVLSLVGETSLAMRTLHNYHSVWKQYGFLPEFYNIPNGEASANRENYPLRPELIESVMYLYRATKDPFLLEVGEDILRSIQYSAKTSCGYATIKNVRDHRKEDRMESFFLAETTKYLYLLFDEKNFLHNEGEEGTKLSTPNGECIIDAGGYVFNTEAHPIDPSALECCYDTSRREDFFENFNYEDFIGESIKLKRSVDNQNEEQDECEQSNVETQENSLTNSEVQKINPKEAARKIAMEVIKNFEKIEIEFQSNDMLRDDLIKENLPSFIKDKNKSEQKEQNGRTKKNILNDMESWENEKFFKNINHKTSEFLKTEEERMMEVLKIVANSTISHLNSSSEADETTSDFWNNTEASKIYMSDLLEKYKFKARGDLYSNVIRDLSRIQDEYSNTTEQLTTEFIISKLIIFLEKMPDLKIENHTNEIDKKILNILLNAQENYESAMAHKAIDIHLYQLISNFERIDNLEKLKKMVKRIRQADIIKSEMYNNKSETVLNRDVFEFLEHRIKLYLAFTELKTESKSTKNEKKVETNLSTENTLSLADVLTPNDRNSNAETEIESKIEFEKKENSVNEVKESVQDDDDIIVVDRSKENIQGSTDDKDTGLGSLEEISLDNVMSDNESNQNANKPEISASLTNNNPYNQEIPSPDLTVTEDLSKNSVFTEFLKSILKTTMRSKKTFDPDLLLARIRKTGFYLNKTQNYELFHCKAQPFLNRFSLRGQFFDD